MHRSRRRKEKWVKHYSSFHEILIVGDGDFSFSLCLALSFGSAYNIIASSLDSFDAVIKKYVDAKANLEMLDKLGAKCLHGLDATKMKLHSDLQMRKFDHIVYNFPHAGFHGKEESLRIINMHRNLVYGFFRNARAMLRSNSEIHVNHKTTPPFCHWNIQELANQNSLVLMESVDFKIKDYPGYRNKRGSGGRCDEPFPLGKCSTFKFRLSPTANKRSPSRRKRNCDSAYNKPRKVQKIQPPVPRLPKFSLQHSENPSMYLKERTRTNDCSRISEECYFKHAIETVVDSDYDVGMYLKNHTRRNNCCRISEEYYFENMIETFGNSDYDVGHYTRKSLRLGFERCTAERSGKPLNYTTLGRASSGSAMYAIRLR